MAERGVHPDCVNASNPYHECVEECYRKIAVSKYQKSQSFPGYDIASDDHQSSSKRKNRVKSKLTDVLGKVTKRSVSALNAHSSPSNLTSPKKELESGIPFTSVPYSGEIQVEDFSSHSGELRSFYSAAMSENVKSPLFLLPNHPVEASSESATSIAMSTQPKDVEHDKQHTSYEGEGAPHLGFRTVSSSIPDIVHPFEESSKEEVHSVVSDSPVSVGKYYVKESVSSILQSIFDRYGDIAESCRLESVSIRSYCLECVCLLIHDLQSSSFTQLTESRIQEMSAILKDLESANMKVDWLRRVLDRLSEDWELIAQQEAIKSEKAMSDYGLEILQKELELQLEELANKEKEVTDTKARVAETEDRLRQLEIESSKLEDSIVNLSSQVESHNISSLLDELV